MTNSLLKKLKQILKQSIFKQVKINLSHFSLCLLQNFLWVKSNFSYMNFNLIISNVQRQQKMKLELWDILSSN